MDPLLRVMDDPFLESQGTKELGKPEKREGHSGKGAIAKGLRRLCRSLPDQVKKLVSTF